MYYKMLPTGQLKMVLSATEMAELQIHLAEESLDSPDLRFVFLRLLSSIEEDIAFEPPPSTLLIELSPTQSQGCIAIFTPIIGDEQVLYPTIYFSFPTIISFYDGGIQLFCQYSSQIFHSYGYLFGNSYILAISTICDPKEIIDFMANFATILPSTPLIRPLLAEQGSLIGNDNFLLQLYTAHQEVFTSNP